MEKLIVKIIFGSKSFYLLTDFHFFVATFMTFGEQKNDKSTLFPGDVSVKF